MNNIKEWEDESEVLVKELEQFAYEYKCNKCSEFYCGHMLKDRARKFGRRIDSNMMDLVKIAKI